MDSGSTNTREGAVKTGAPDKRKLPGAFNNSCWANSASQREAKTSHAEGPVVANHLVDLRQHRLWCFYHYLDARGFGLFFWVLLGSGYLSQGQDPIHKGCAGTLPMGRPSAWEVDFGGCCDLSQNYTGCADRKRPASFHKM